MTQDPFASIRKAVEFGYTLRAYEARALLAELDRLREDCKEMFLYLKRQGIEMKKFCSTCQRERPIEGGLRERYRWLCAECVTARREKTRSSLYSKEKSK